MTQTPPSSDPVPPPVTSGLPATLWRQLDSRRQHQLAHCLCELIQRIWAANSPGAKEHCHDVNEHES